MPKTLFILIQFILIFEIVFSSKYKTIEIEDFEPTKQQNIQSTFKFNNHLIFLSSDKFKYCILPYLSSHNFVKIYLHFQNLVPELTFQKFLPPSRFYTTNNVLDIQKPITYLESLEINLLYQFNGEYSSLEPHILYSLKNKVPICCKPNIFTHLDSICAHLSQNKIIPYETFVISNSRQELLILTDDEGDQFFVTFEKTKGQFINIARCSGVSTPKFPYLESIWEAYNLQGLKKHYWKLKLILNMPYDKYLFYVVKIFSCFGSSLNQLSDIFVEHLEKYKHQNWVENVAWLFCFLLVVIFSGAKLTVLLLWYYAILLPFFMVTLSLKQFVFGFNLSSFLFLSQGLASLYVCFFSQIKNCMPFKYGEVETIEPCEIMSVVPLMIQKRKMIFDTLIFCYLIFFCGFPITIFFAINDGAFSVIPAMLVGLFVGARVLL